MTHYTVPIDKIVRETLEKGELIDSTMVLGQFVNDQLRSIRKAMYAARDLAVYPDDTIVRSVESHAAEHLMVVNSPDFNDPFDSPEVDIPIAESYLLFDVSEGDVYTPNSGGVNVEFEDDRGMVKEAIVQYRLMIGPHHFEEDDLTLALYELNVA